MRPEFPNEERQELIDKGHVAPDPFCDRMTHEDWFKQGKSLTKVQQYWRRTMDDFRGRTKTLQERTQSSDQLER